jgi:hypothetical protein
MSLFVFSMLAGFLLYQAVSLIQPITGTGDYRIGRRVVVHLPPEAYLVWKASLIALTIVLFVLVAILIIAQPFHPAEGYAYRFVDALTSPHMAGAVFGGLVGLLVGNLLNRILHQKPDYSFRPSDYLEIILILVLVVLGIGGEELLQSYARRINKISLGTTTEISFSESQPKSSRTAAEQPNRFNTTGTGNESGVPAGLQVLESLSRYIKVDKDPRYRSDDEFIAILIRYERTPRTGTAVFVGSFPSDVLNPIGKCLVRLSYLTGDAVLVEEVLQPLSDALRDLDTATEGLWEVITADFEIAGDLDRSEAALNRFMKNQANLRALWKSDCAPFNQEFDLRSLEQFRDSADRAPYIAIAYSSVMAGLHHYDAAAITMYRWIESYKKTTDAKTVQGRWFLTRARVAQAIFVDEWLRVRGLAASSSLREYHIKNLAEIVEDLGSFKVIDEIRRSNDGFSWSPGVLGASSTGDDGTCVIPDIPKSDTQSAAKSQADHVTRPDDIPDGPVNNRDDFTIRKMYDTFLSTKRDYVDQALKHPVMKIESARTIATEARASMKLDLRCITTDRAITRAEQIERYVRSEINLMDNESSLKSSDQLRDRIRDLQQLLAVAFQLVKPIVADAMDVKRHADSKIPTGLQTRLRQDWSLEIYETLYATRDQLQNFSEREVTP